MTLPAGLGGQVRINGTKLEFEDLDLGATRTLKDLAVVSLEIVDGWTATGTFIYSSVTRINLSITGAIYVFKPGDKIRIVQLGGWRYYNVIAVGDSYLDVTGGSDFTVNNSAITQPAYSHIENPMGFPPYFNWVPTKTYSGGTTDPTSNTINSAKFFIIQRTVFFELTATIVKGAGNRTIVYFTLPVNNINTVYLGAGNTVFTSLNYGSAYIDTNLLCFWGTGAMVGDGILSVRGSYFY